MGEQRLSPMFVLLQNLSSRARLSFTPIQNLYVLYVTQGRQQSFCKGPDHEYSSFADTKVSGKTAQPLL